MANDSYVPTRIKEGIPRRWLIGQIMREFVQETNKFKTPKSIWDMFERHAYYENVDSHHCIVKPTWLQPYVDRLESIEVTPPELVKKKSKKKKKKQLRLAFAAPPQHGKTTVTYAFMSFLPWHPSLAGLQTWLLSYNGDEAGRKLNEFCTWLNHVNVPFFKKGSCVTMTPKDGIRTRVMFGSAPNGSTGKPFPGLTIFDDPLSGKMTLSKNEKDHLWYLWDSDYGSRCAGPIVIMATRWCKDDLTGRLLDHPDEGFEYIRIPCESEGEDVDPLKRPKGELLWPQKWDWDVLKPRKNNKMSWSPVYQGVPLSEASRLISYPGRWNELPSVLKTAYGMDCGMGGDKKNDPSCIYRIEADVRKPMSERVYYVTGGIRELRLGPFGGHTVEETDENRGWGRMFGDFVKQKPAQVRWDYGGQERGIAQAVNKFFPYPIIAIPASAGGSKHQRAQKMIEAINEGRFMFPNTDEQWVLQCIEALTSWNPDFHDGSDDLDALASAFKLLSTNEFEVKDQREVIERMNDARSIDRGFDGHQPSPPVRSLSNKKKQSFSPFRTLGRRERTI